MPLDADLPAYAAALRAAGWTVTEPGADLLRVTHDPEHGLSYIYVTGQIEQDGAKITLEAGPGINPDFGANGALIGIELLQANLLHPALLALARKSGARPVEERGDDGSSGCRSLRRFRASRS